jgi:hypothetical protein
MIIKTFYHQLESGENVKFTIQDKYFGNERYYCANLINIDLDIYKNLSKHEQESYLGMFITNGRQGRIYYKDPNRLENDIKNHYGKKWLESEI